MPMTPWDEVAGKRCRCGQWATHIYGSEFMCCACHGGDVISQDEADEIQNNMAREKEARTSGTG